MITFIKDQRRVFPVPVYTCDFCDLSTFLPLRDWYVDEARGWVLCPRCAGLSGAPAHPAPPVPPPPATRPCA